MSYCRWNDDCDVYAYEDTSGIAIHYAKVEGNDAHSVYGLSEDEAALELERAIKDGYKVPQRAIDILWEEAEDRLAEHMRNLEEHRRRVREDDFDTPDSLKPCPYCGQVPNTVEVFGGTNHTDYGAIVICGCKAQGPFSGRHKTAYAARIAAITAWNRRVTPNAGTVMVPCGSPNDDTNPIWTCTHCGATQIASELLDAEDHRTTIAFCPNCGRSVLDFHPRTSVDEDPSGTLMNLYMTFASNHKNEE